MYIKKYNFKLIFSIVISSKENYDEVIVEVSQLISVNKVKKCLLNINYYFFK